MRERAIASVIFGLVFSLVLTGLTFFVPTITKYGCDGDVGYSNARYQLVGVVAVNLGSDDCNIGRVEKGIPFSTRYKSGFDQNPNHDYKTNPVGIFGNIIVFTLLGFMLFMIFSPNKRTMEMRKFSKSH